MKTVGSPNSLFSAFQAISKYFTLVATGVFLRADPVPISPTVTGSGVVLGAGTFEFGTQFSLRAVPQVDWQFDHWEGVPTDSAHTNPITLTAATDLHPVAVMAASPGAGYFAGGTVVSYNAAVPAALTSAVAVSAGGAVAGAIKPDGTVVVWGANDFHQTNVPPGLNQVVALEVGPFHCLALKRDGTVVAWGNNSAGQTNVPPGLSNVVAVAAGSNHSVALKEDGSIVAWGANNAGQTSLPAGLRDIVAISAGDGFTLAVKSDGSAGVWGKLHVPSGDYIPAVLPANFTNLVSVSSSLSYTLGLSADGTVADWGYIDIYSNGTPPNLQNIRAVAAGWEDGLAINTENTLEYWGRPQLDPVVDPLPNVVTADAGDQFFYAIQGPAFGLLRADRNAMFQEVGQRVFLAPQTVGGKGYQWLHDGQPLPGANSAVLTISSLSMSDAGIYQMIVTNETDALLTPATGLQIVPAGYPRVVLNGAEVRGSNRVGQAKIALTTTLSDAQIFYTLDGSAPTIQSARYTLPIDLLLNTKVTVRALAISGDFSQQATNAPVEISVLPTYTVTVTVSGPGHVLETPSQGQFLQGDYVTLQAIPNDNAVFAGWTKDLSGTDPVRDVVVDRNWTIQANFQDAPKFSPTIIAPAGAVTVNPAGPQYAGTDVSITALPLEGWTFEGWSGDQTGTETNFIWHVTGNATFTANYDTTIATTSTGPGHIELNPDLPRYSYGAQVEVIPVADFGNQLALWGMDAAGKPATEWTLTVTNAEPKISALFQASATPAYKISNPTVQTGQLSLHVTGTVGTSFTVQSTTDFTTWTDEKTITLDSTSSVEIALPIATGGDERFYRIRQNQ